MSVIEKSSALSGVSIKALTKLKNYINMVHSDDIYLDMNQVVGFELSSARVGNS